MPLAATYQAALPADARGNGMALRSLADHLVISAASLFVFAVYHGETLSSTGLMWLVVLFAAVGAFVAWWLLLRQTLELVVEFLVWPMYRIRARGPGLDQFPRDGPLLIIANHSSWLDPVWIAKVLPRRVFPMMTSVFYDLPVMRWLMKLGGVIRVQATRFRREVPEIRNAVALLDRGDALLLFPEGWMRRSEQQPVRQFGRGVALLLKERPQTPVLICWIEGGFGSFFSYYNGPPTKNKRLDFRRRIEIGVTAPRVIDPAIIADQRALRNYLMQACLDARTILGLPAVTLRQPVRDRDENGESDSPEQQEPHVHKG